MAKLTGAERQRRWRDKQNALVREAKGLRALPVLDETMLVRNLLRIAEGDGPTAWRAIEFLLKHKFGWSEYTPPKPEPPIGKKQQQQHDAETALDEDEFQEWSDLLQ